MHLPVAHGVDGVVLHGQRMKMVAHHRLQLRCGKDFGLAGFGDKGHRCASFLALGRGAFLRLSGYVFFALIRGALYNPHGHWSEGLLATPTPRRLVADLNPTAGPFAPTSFRRSHLPPSFAIPSFSISISPPNTGFPPSDGRVNISS